MSVPSEPGTLHCRRRVVLAATVAAATGLLLPISATPAKARQVSCRGWCLAYCDTACRGGDRPACGDIASP